jgi:L-fuconolactonase
MTIDAHQHFWQYDPVRNAWIDSSMAVLKRDFLPPDLKPLLAENGLNGCIAVQADQSENETHFLLQLADKHNFIQGVVGWVDLRSARLDERLDYFSQFEKLVGFRHIVQAEKNAKFLLREDFCRGIALLKRHGFTYDILVFPHQLGATLEFVRRFPNQPFVIDHLAKPYIKDGHFDEWASMITAIGQHENVYCKVSGMVTEARWTQWKYEDFLPYLDQVTEVFGPGRLMFGSDWPVCLLAGSYEQVAGIAKRYFESLSLAEQALVFGNTAMSFYGISTAHSWA